MAAIVLSLLSSASFGVADFFGGLASRRYALLTVMVVSQGTGLIGIALLVALRGDGPPDAGFAPFALLASVVGTVGLAALYQGLAVGLMSVVAPLAATAAAIPVVVGAATGESATRLQYAGIAVALGGIVLVSRSQQAGGAGARLATGAGLGILAAVFIGLFFVAIDRASEEDPYWATLVLRCGSLTLIGLAVAIRRPSLRMFGRSALTLPVVGVLDLAGNVLLAVATTKGAVGVVAVLTSLYPVVTVALARLVLHERMTAVQAAGVGAAFAGVALITLG
ncbi:MAG: DMT family transporter [Actinobacteria bacterium]|nr:DMT family transporter [Actinomycetota bacterium]